MLGGMSIISSTAAMLGEVVKAAVAVGGAATEGGACLVAIAMANSVHVVVSVAICCASSALDGALPAMFADCLVLGRMIELLFHKLAGQIACLKLLVSLTCVGACNNFTCCDI